MLPGVYRAIKKDNTVYYRSSINYRNKHISLGSFSTEEEATRAYSEAAVLFSDASLDIHTIFFQDMILPSDKLVVLLNFRDNHLYIKNPIYLRKGYFSYFLSPTMELKFDIDDLFYYSSHKILKRQGHLFVNDYGTQYSILSRYGIKPYAVAERDYSFSNGDSTDYRYSNIIVKNRFHGVQQFYHKGNLRYKCYIHINGNYKIGIYSTEYKAAIAYNKAVDQAKAAGICKNFSENYIENLSPKEYADIYTHIKLSKRYLAYLEQQNIRE